MRQPPGKPVQNVYRSPEMKIIRIVLTLKQSKFRELVSQDGSLLYPFRTLLEGEVNSLTKVKLL